VTEVFEASGFTAPQDHTIRLHSSKPTWCASIEPIAPSFDLTEVIPASLVMTSAGTGDVGSVTALTEKTLMIEDRNANGVTDLRVCFSKDDLRALFSNLTGQNEVPVTIGGSLNSGGASRPP
jgi:hypothetical protein